MIVSKINAAFFLTAVVTSWYNVSDINSSFSPLQLHLNLSQALTK